MDEKKPKPSISDLSLKADYNNFTSIRSRGSLSGSKKPILPDLFTTLSVSRAVAMFCVVAMTNDSKDLSKILLSGRLIDPSDGKSRPITASERLYIKGDYDLLCGAIKSVSRQLRDQSVVGIFVIEGYAKRILK